MKSKIFLLSLLSIPLLASAKTRQQYLDMWKNPTFYLDAIMAKRSIPPESLGDNDRLEDDLQNMAYVISQDIMKDEESKDWAHPSPERKAVIEKWGKILQPYTADLVKLVFDKENENIDDSVRTQSRSLLDYAAPTQEFAEQVRKYLNQSLDDSFRAADLLYEHRLLTNADKEALRQLKPPEDRGRDLEGWAVGMCYYGMLDGLEIAKKALSKEPQGEIPEEIIAHYGDSLGIAGSIGPDAAILLPEIEALIAHPKISSSGYLNHFKYARDAITGKAARQTRSAINGSGPLGPTHEARDLEKQETDSSLEPRPSPKKLVEQKKVPSMLSEIVISSRWWLVVTVMIVAAGGLLGYWLKRRSE
jgi:hypothetical protein